MRHCLYCASDNSCVNYAACSSLIVQTRCDLKPFAHFERESVRGVIHTGCLWNVSQKVSNYFICYLMNKYELYLTFSIIIISPVPDRDWDGAAACRAKPLMARASSDRDRFFEIGLFRDHRSNTMVTKHDTDQYPINRSTPIVNVFTVTDNFNTSLNKSIF